MDAVGSRSLYDLARWTLETLCRFVLAAILPTGFNFLFQGLEVIFTTFFTTLHFLCYIPKSDQIHDIH